MTTPTYHWAMPACLLGITGDDSELRGSAWLPRFRRIALARHRRGGGPAKAKLYTPMTDVDAPLRAVTGTVTVDNSGHVDNPAGYCACGQSLAGHVWYYCDQS